MVLTNSMHMQVMTQGLEAAINTYAQNALALAAEPVSALGINNTYLDLIARCGPYEVLEGIETLATHLMGKAEAVNTRLMTIEVSFVPACMTQQSFSVRYT